MSFLFLGRVMPRVVLQKFILLSKGGKKNLFLFLGRVMPRVVLQKFILVSKGAKKNLLHNPLHN